MPSDPLDALAAQHGAVASAAEPDALDALAAQHGATTQDATFRTTNLPPTPEMWAQTLQGQAFKDAGSMLGGLAEGTLVDTARGIGALFKDASQQIKPGEPPELSASRIAMHLAKAYGTASWQQLQQAGRLLARASATYGREGVSPNVAADVSEAAGRVAFAAFPPAETMGRLMEKGITAHDPWSLGRGIGQFATLALPELAQGLGDVRLAAGGPVNPADAQAVRWAMGQNLPVDVPTATGSPFLKGVQTFVGKLPGGGGPTMASQQAMAEGLAAKGAELAEQVRPGGQVLPYEAGQGIRAGLSQQISAARAGQRQSYGAIEEAAQLPENMDIVPRAPTAAEQAAGQAAAAARAPLQQKSLGAIPTEAELTELRRIREELDTFPYVKRTWTEAPRKTGTAAGGDYDITAGAAGAAVYDDILAAQGTGRPTRATVLRAIDSALDTGHYTTPAKAALAVARGRLAGAPELSPPWLPPGAGSPAPPTQAVPLAIDMRDVQQAVEPLRQQLQNAHDIVPLQGGVANVLRALTQITSSPRFVSLTDADAALGDLKAMARADYPELRGRAQAMAARAIGPLSDAIDARAATAAGDVEDALALGRSFTKEKVAAQKLFKRATAEPVDVYQALVRRHDAGFDRLNAILQAAPETGPLIGRAWLEQRLEKATAGGAFENTKAIWNDYRDLGPRTKALLFPGTADDIGQFLQFAQRYNIPANPSGTGPILVQVAAGKWLLQHPAGWSVVLPTRWLAQMLASPTVARTLTKGVTVPLKSAAALGIADDIATAAAQVSRMPTAAEQQQTPPPAVAGTLSRP